jgi:hypothetical protein
VIVIEKKTFKNPSSVLNTFDPEHVWLVEGFRVDSNYFTHREWDMEVTFTKKVKPLAVGDKVTHYGNEAEVIGTYGDFLWLFVPLGTPQLTIAHVEMVQRVS